MKEALHFRKASLSDAEAIQKLVNSAYRGDSSRQGWTTEADLLAGQRTDRRAIEEIINQSNSVILLAEMDSEIIGSVQLEKKDDRICYFGMFTVKPQIQGQGLGKKLMQEAENFAHQYWKSEMMEMTVITLRTELMNWYLKHGYQRTNETKPFPYGDERFGLPLRPDLEMTVLRKSL